MHTSRTKCYSHVTIWYVFTPVRPKQHIFDFACVNILCVCVYLTNFCVQNWECLSPHFNIYIFLAYISFLFVVSYKVRKECAYKEKLPSFSCIASVSTLMHAFHYYCITLTTHTQNKMLLLWKNRTETTTQPGEIFIYLLHTLRTWYNKNLNSHKQALNLFNLISN